MTRLFLLAAFAAALSGCVAEAGYYLSADECLEDRECRREWRHEKRQERAQRRHRYISHVKKRERRDRDELPLLKVGGPVCQPRVVTATGEKALSQENAEIYALRIWKSEVAFEFGEQYLDFHKARRPEIHCAPVGIADTITGKIKEKFLGVTHWRCRLSGYPCRGRPEPVSRDD